MGISMSFVQLIFFWCVEMVSESVKSSTQTDLECLCRCEETSKRYTLKASNFMTILKLLLILSGIETHYVSFLSLSFHASHCNDEMANSECISGILNGERCGEVYKQ